MEAPTPLVDQLDNSSFGSSEFLAEQLLHYYKQHCFSIIIMAHPHDHKHHSHLHKHHSHHHDRGYPHEKYHMYGRRGPTRFLWFAIGVGSAVWWFRCPRERENNPSRGGSFPHWDRTGASTHRPGTVPMNWNDYQERAGAQMRETVSYISFSNMEEIY